jgi:hypothetical protein
MSMNWTVISLFKGIDLNDSFVLGWSLEPGRLAFELEASIWPESGYYTAAKPDEYTCYRKATLEFVGIDEVHGLLPIESVRFAQGPDGSIDYGNIDVLVKLESTYQVVGDFGEVEIIGGELRFAVHT